MAEKKKTAKTAPKSRVGARKKVNEGNLSTEEKNGSQAKKRAVAENAKTTRGSGSKKSGLSRGNATSDSRKEGAAEKKASKSAEKAEVGGKRSKSTSGLSHGKATSESDKASVAEKKSSKPAEKSGTGKAAKSALPAEPKQVIFSLQAGTPIYVKTADICAATGKTNQWIGQLTAQGVIHKTKTNHGSLYELFETTKAYCEMLEERAKKEDEDVLEIELKRKKSEARLKESKATIAELEAKEFQGKMHRSEDVQAMTADLLYFIRGGLIALAGRCANECAASSEPAEVQKIIEREVFAILQDISNYKYDRKRYDELVRQRMKRELDADYFTEEEEEN